MLFHPFEGFLLSLFLDVADWYILIWSGLEKKYYHVIDKPLDYLCYIFLIPVLVDTPVFGLYMATTIYRGIGYIAYYTLNTRKVFVIFADFPQVVALLYFVQQLYLPGLNIFDTKLLAVLFSLKVMYEFLPHYFNLAVTHDWLLVMRKKYAGY
jgi:hypothetical protein